MDRKHHWAYPALTRAGLSREQLLSHFRHEYLVYVRDFPVLLAREPWSGQRWVGPMVLAVHDRKQALS